MKIYILTERAKSNGQHHDRVIGCYEDYNYALIMKAKYEAQGTLNTYFINDQDLIEGNITTWEENGEVMLKDEDFNTVAVVEHEPFENFYDQEVGVFPNGTVKWETVTKWEVDEIEIFGQALISIGLDDCLTREIENQIQNQVDKKNEEL